jgi:hypothetical protein
VLIPILQADVDAVQPMGFFYSLAAFVARANVQMVRDCAWDFFHHE